MADTMKKAKAPAKPRKTAGKKEKVIKAAMQSMPSRKKLRKLARAYLGAAWTTRMDLRSRTGFARAATAQNGLVEKPRFDGFESTSHRLPPSRLERLRAARDPRRLCATPSSRTEPTDSTAGAAASA